MSASGSPATGAYEAAVARVAEAVSPDELDKAVDAYIAAAEAAAEESGDDDARFGAVVAGDLRLLAHLADLDTPDDDTDAVVASLAASLAAPTSPAFLADMAAVARGIGGAPPPEEAGGGPVVALSQATPVEQGEAAVDAIVTEASGAADKVFASLVVPSGKDVTDVAGLVGGKTGAQLARDVLGALSWFRRTVKEAAAKVMGALLDRLIARLGAGTTSHVLQVVRDWIARKLGDLDILAIVLGAAELKQVVGAELAKSPATAPRRADAASALADQHARVQRWVRWGAGALAAAKMLHLDKAAPWGPVLMGAAGLLLLVFCVWEANDYLDARDWPLDRVRGVRAVVAAA
jgi:hypothetical protein